MANMKTTEALVVRSPGAPWKLETINLDSIREDEALVEIHYTGICHTDIKATSGKFMIGPPMVPGHEGITSHASSPPPPRQKQKQRNPNLTNHPQNQAQA